MQHQQLQQNSSRQMSSCRKGSWMKSQHPTSRDLAILCCHEVSKMPDHAQLGLPVLHSVQRGTHLSHFLPL